MDHRKYWFWATPLILIIPYNTRILGAHGRPALARQPGGPRTGGSPLASRGWARRGSPRFRGGVSEPREGSGGQGGLREALFGPPWDPQVPGPPRGTAGPRREGLM